MSSTPLGYMIDFFFKLHGQFRLEDAATELLTALLFNISPPLQPTPHILSEDKAIWCFKVFILKLNSR